MKERTKSETKRKNIRLNWVHLIAALILLIAAYIVVNGNPYIKAVREASSQTMFDMKFGNTLEETYQYLNKLGEAGRHAYVRFSLLIDMIFPVIYSSVYFVILLFLKQRIENPHPILNKVIFIPFLSGFFDVLENSSIVILISNYPNQYPRVLELLNIMTTSKWASILLSMIIISVFIVLLSLQKQKLKSDDKQIKKLRWKELNIQTKYRICILGLTSSLMLLTLLILLASMNSFITDIFPKNSLLSSTPTRELIETDVGTLYLPKGFSTEKEYPLIVIYHELGGHHTGTLSKFHWLEIADEYQLILFSVRSHLPTWHYDKESPDLKNTQRIIKQLKKELPIKKNHTAIYGFSAGAHYVNYLSLHNFRFPNKRWFDAFIQISGGSCVELDRYIKKEFIPRRLTASASPGYIVWGEKEIPPPGKKASAFFINQGWDITTHPHDGLHFVPEGEIELAMEWFLGKRDKGIILKKGDINN